jgi:hypothetical protein
VWAANEALVVKLAMPWPSASSCTNWKPSRTGHRRFSGALNSCRSNISRFPGTSRRPGRPGSVPGGTADQVKGLVKVTFQPDPELGRGEIIMETDAGRLDATLRRRIAALTSVIDDELKRNLDLDW